jgi:hypothetical protein
MHTRHNTPAADASITVVRPQAQTHTVCCLLLRRSGTYDPPRKQPSHRRKGDKYSGRYAEEQDVDSADEDTMAMRKHHAARGTPTHATVTTSNARAHARTACASPANTVDVVTAVSDDRLPHH